MKTIIIFIMLFFINFVCNIGVLRSEDEHECHGGHELSESHSKHDRNEVHEERDEYNDPEDHEDVVVLSQKDIDDFDIETLEAKEGMISDTITLLGEVVVNANKQAHITPRFAGLVLEVKKEEGDHVKKGDALALIEANDSLNAYELKSLIDGVILKRHITVGEVHGGNSIAFVIADLNDLWVHLSIYQKDMPLIKEGQDVIISLSDEISEVRGVVSYISPIIDAATRTSIARVELKNKNNVFKPGMFVKSKVLFENEKVKVCVEKEALQLVEGRKCVFIKKDKNKFEAIPVETGHEDEEYIEIISGLDKGDLYVAHGSFVLKSELEKGAFGDGHNH